MCFGVTYLSENILDFKWFKQILSYTQHALEIALFLLWWLSSMLTSFSEFYLLGHQFLFTASIKVLYGHLSILHYTAALGFLHVDDPWCIVLGCTNLILGQLPCLWPILHNGVQDCVSSGTANIYYLLNPEYRELFLLPQKCYLSSNQIPMIFHFYWIAVWIIHPPSFFFFPISLKVPLSYKDCLELTMLLFNYPSQWLGAFPVPD